MRPLDGPVWCASPPAGGEVRHRVGTAEIRAASLTVTACPEHPAAEPPPLLPCHRCTHARFDHAAYQVAVIGKRWHECRVCTCRGYVANW